MTNRSLVASASSVRTVEDFKKWARRHLRAALPHEAGLFGLGHLHAAGVGIDYVILVDCPSEYVDAIRNRAGAIDTPLVRRWLAEREPQMFDADNPWPEAPREWLDNFRRFGWRNAIGHAQQDDTRCVGSYHNLYNVSGAPNASHAQILREVVPLLHELLYRVIDNLVTTDRVVGGSSALTDREREVIRWLRLGKTNAQIANLMQISETTVKHHLTTIFEKFDVSNRAQLVRLLVEHDARRTPTSQTQVY